MGRGQKNQTSWLLIFSPSGVYVSDDNIISKRPSEANTRGGAFPRDTRTLWKAKPGMSAPPPSSTSARDDDPRLQHVDPERKISVLKKAAIALTEKVESLKVELKVARTEIDSLKVENHRLRKEASDKSSEAAQLALDLKRARQELSDVNRASAVSSVLGAAAGPATTTMTPSGPRPHHHGTTNDTTAVATTADGLHPSAPVGTGALRSFGAFLTSVVHSTSAATEATGDSAASTGRSATGNDAPTARADAATKEAAEALLEQNQTLLMQQFEFKKTSDAQIKMLHDQVARLEREVQIERQAVRAAIKSSTESADLKRCRDEVARIASLNEALRLEVEFHAAIARVARKEVGRQCHRDDGVVHRGSSMPPQKPHDQLAAAFHNVVDFHLSKAPRGTLADVLALPFVSDVMAAVFAGLLRNATSSTVQASALLSFGIESSSLGIIVEPLARYVLPPSLLEDSTLSGFGHGGGLDAYFGSAAHANVHMNGSRWPLDLEALLHTVVATFRAAALDLQLVEASNCADVAAEPEQVASPTAQHRQAQLGAMRQYLSVTSYAPTTGPTAHSPTSSDAQVVAVYLRAIRTAATSLESAGRRLRSAGETAFEDLASNRSNAESRGGGAAAAASGATHIWHATLELMDSIQVTAFGLAIAAVVIAAWPSVGRDETGGEAAARTQASDLEQQIMHDGAAAAVKSIVEAARVTKSQVQFAVDARVGVVVTFGHAAANFSSGTALLLLIAALSAMHRPLDAWMNVLLALDAVVPAAGVAHGMREGDGSATMRRVAQVPPGLALLEADDHASLSVRPSASLITLRAVIEALQALLQHWTSALPSTARESLQRWCTGTSGGRQARARVRFLAPSHLPGDKTNGVAPDPDDSSMTTGLQRMLRREVDDAAPTQCDRHWAQIVRGVDDECAAWHDSYVVALCELDELNSQAEGVRDENVRLRATMQQLQADKEFASDAYQRQIELLSERLTELHAAA